MPPWMREFGYNMERFFDNIQGWQIAAVVIGFILFILIMVAITTALSTIGRIGLIQGTLKAEEEVESMTFGELFESGKPFFWRILGFNLLVGLAIFLLVLILIVPIVLVTALTFGVAMVCLIPLICLLIPVSWLVTVILEQANIAIVVEDLSMLDGLKQGWEVFRENIGNMIVMGLILGLGGAVVGFVMALPIFFTMMPLLIGGVAAAANESPMFAGSGMVVSAVCCLSYLPVLILLSGILQAYIKTAWTLTYLRLTGQSAPPVVAGEEALPEEAPVEESLPDDDMDIQEVEAGEE